MQGHFLGHEFDGEGKMKNAAGTTVSGIFKVGFPVDVTVHWFDGHTAAFDSMSFRRGEYTKGAEHPQVIEMRDKGECTANGTQIGQLMWGCRGCEATVCKTCYQHKCH